MQLHQKRRRALRKAGIATMLTMSALVISGCDFTNVFPGSRYTNVLIKKSASDQLIFHCTGNPGPGRDRAGCVLDTVRALCNKWPQDGFALWQCIRATNSDDPWLRLDMEGAIQTVTGPADCLAVVLDAQNQWVYNWYGEYGLNCYG